MACPEQREWLSNRSQVEFVDYHRPFLHPLEFISLVIILVVAVSFNFAIIFTIVRVRSLRRKLGNMLIINLCVMDLIISLDSMIPSLIDIFSEGYFLCVEVFCKIHGVLTTFGCLGNFVAITLIAGHRFLNVFAKDRINLTAKHVGFMIVGGWALTLAIVIPPIGSNATTVYTHNTHHCSPTWSCGYFMTCVSIIYAGAVPTMIACYSAIFWKVRSSRKRLILYKRNGNSDDESCLSKQQHTANEHRECLANTNPKSGKNGDSFQLDSGICFTVVSPATSEDRKSSEQVVNEVNDSCQSGGRNGKVERKVNRFQEVDIRIAFAGSLLVMTTAICWAPYVIVNWCTRSNRQSHAVNVFAMWLAYANSALDPIVYSVLNKELRNSMQTQVGLLFRFFQGNFRTTN